MTNWQALKPYYVFVKTISGRTIVFSMKASDTIDKLMAKISGSEAIPEEEMLLSFNGKQIVDGHTLRHYNIQREETVHVVPPVISQFRAFSFYLFIFLFLRY